LSSCSFVGFYATFTKFKNFISPTFLTLIFFSTFYIYEFLRPHRVHIVHKMRPVATHGAVWSVGLLVTFLSSVKMAESIQMPFGARRVGSRNHVLDGGPDPKSTGKFGVNLSGPFKSIGSLAPGYTKAPEPIDMPFGVDSWVQATTYYMGLKVSRRKRQFLGLPGPLKSIVICKSLLRSPQQTSITTSAAVYSAKGSFHRQ